MKTFYIKCSSGTKVGENNEAEVTTCYNVMCHDTEEPKKDIILHACKGRPQEAIDRLTFYYNMYEKAKPNFSEDDRIAEINIEVEEYKAELRKRRDAMAAAYREMSVAELQALAASLDLKPKKETKEALKGRIEAEQMRRMQEVGISR